MHGPQDTMSSSEGANPQPKGDAAAPPARTDIAGRTADERPGLPSGRGDGPFPSGPGPSAGPKALRPFLAATGKRLATLAIALIAILIAIVTWQTYVLGPWTRNGNVRVQVASVAPQVSGQIVDLRVNDNQYVKQGDVLYVIDPIDFQLAVESSKAQVAQAAADLQLKDVESKRRQSLSNLATTPEEQQTYAAAAAVAKATFDVAQQQQAKAELDLKRTKVLSPVTGYVTNLLLRVGDFAVAGASNVTVIDSESFWIDGYFEETKMAGVCVNDRVEAQLMGYGAPIVGRVETVTRGISVSNAAAGAQGLPNVDPIYTWVRLAQRVPVRIAIDEVPGGVPLVSGMTATVTIKQADGADRPSLFDRGYASVVDSISSLVYGPPPPRPGCLPVMTNEAAPTEALPVAAKPAAQSAGQVEPGIAPGLDVSPKVAD
ncbi:MAG TPA: HlyD family secretion protein [Rhizobiaceae bacterium]